jgi:phosphoglucosamine mutase
MTSHFGTDGIRGRAGEKLTAELALRAAGGFAQGIAKHAARAGRATVVVGCDPRLSSPMLVAATTAGLLQAGCDVLDLGIVPTPVVPFKLLARKAGGGIMITASHNPVPDNGIKFFGADGFKIGTDVEAAIEHAIDKGTGHLANADFGTVVSLDAQPAYLAFLRKVVRSASNGHTLRIVLDCACGATSELAPRAFEQAGFEIDVINGRFDGSRINVNSGATDLQMLASRVKKTKADLGLAFDGDGDRVLAVDHLGRAVSGDKIIALMATRIKAYRDQGAVVMTQMTNLGVEETLGRQGVHLHRTEVGDIQVLKGMQAAGLSLGGEQSGHVIMLDLATSGDGILTGLRLADLVRKAKRPLAELVADFPEFPQKLTNLQLRDKEAWRRSKALTRELARVRSSYPDVRFYLRPSGTENLIRVLTESRSAEQCTLGNEAACRALRDWNSG